MRVYVHLAFGFDAAQWSSRWSRGEIIGLNEPVPYGYHHAEKHGVSLTYSKDRAESTLGRLGRGAVRMVLGFDLVHAWRNRRSLVGVDAVWTHTESQHLAISLIIFVMRRLRQLDGEPLLVAQSVWLFDDWPNMGHIRRYFYRQLMSRASVLTVHSPDNWRAAKRVFPDASVELLEFGIPSRDPNFRRPEGSVSASVTEIIAVGNDRHRDWNCLLEATRGKEDLSVTIVSRTVDVSLLADHHAVVVTPTGNDELRQIYQKADVAVVPLGENLHASGLTAVLEAIAYGVPVVVSNSGGLSHYFSKSDVLFVDAGKPDLLLEAICALANNHEMRGERAVRAREGVQERALTSEGFAERHVWLTSRLMHDRKRAATRLIDNAESGRTIEGVSVAMKRFSMLPAAAFIMRGYMRIQGILRPRRIGTTGRGLRFYCDIRDFIQRRIYYFGIFEHNLTEVFEVSVRPGFRVIDIGSNIGYFTILASKLVGPDGTVDAIEADPRVATLLRKNLSLNGSPSNVSVWNVAVTAEKCFVSTVLEDSRNLGSTVVRTSQTQIGGGEGEIRGVPLDEVGVNLAEANFIKIDIEGAERAPLTTILDNLSLMRRDVAIAVELQPDSADMVEKFKAAGFSAYLIPNDYSVEFYLSRRFRRGIERPAHMLETDRYDINSTDYFFIRNGN